MTESNLTVRASVSANTGQRWGAWCHDCEVGELTRRPEGYPGLPKTINKFLIRHREHDTECGTAMTSHTVRHLYAEVGRTRVRDTDECEGCGNERHIVQAGYCRECMEASLYQRGGSFL